VPLVGQSPRQGGAYRLAEPSLCAAPLANDGGMAESREWAEHGNVARGVLPDQGANRVLSPPWPMRDSVGIYTLLWPLPESACCRFRYIHTAGTVHATRPADRSWCTSQPGATHWPRGMGMVFLGFSYARAFPAARLLGSNRGPNSETRRMNCLNDGSWIHPFPPRVMAYRCQKSECQFQFRQRHSGYLPRVLHTIY